MIIGNKDFDISKTYIMGILNVTPDSFSDGGKFNNIDSALAHCEEMINDGAAIIDVGGESTRPGYTQISVSEEIERVAPVIESIKKHFDVPVSLDTYKSSVAEAGIRAGADLINDIWGLKYDKEMAALIAKYGKPCCIMHNRDNTDYKNFPEDILSDLQESIEIALNAGISDENIILDPGVGFAKTLEQNLLVVKNLDIFHKLGYPLLLGTSRKSLIGLTLDLPKDERMEGTLATSVLAAWQKYMFVRVHDVKENYRAVAMTSAIFNA